MRQIILFIACITSIPTSFSQVKPGGIFTDHMVLQRNAAIPVWGWAAKGEKITVSFHAQVKKTVADKTGKWTVYLDNETAGGPWMLTIQGKKNTVTLNDILVGDVWICSGQSNMEWPLSATMNASAEIAAASNPQVRHFKVEHAVSVVPVDDVKPSSWKICTPATAPEFTAVGYYFAKRLQEELHVPIGLVNSSWGGTMVETWISKTGLQTSGNFAAVASQLPASMEQFEKDEVERIRKSVAGFQYTDAAEIVKGWESPAYDDRRWSKLLAPKQWEEQGLNNLDGTVWYRKNISLTAAQASKNAVIWLGKIDDCDSAYINGVLVGSTCVYDQLRKYSIPAKLLKEGQNTIVVKVLDTGGGGGIWGDAADVKMETAEGDIPLAGEWKARVDVNASIVSTSPNSMPALLYNGMVHPLLPLAVKGVIWYQGETNASRAKQYEESFPLLINDWRNKFSQATMPFYYVQLASFNASNQNGTEGSAWAELREAQFKTLSVSNTGMAVTADIGDAKDIHPRNKKDVGGRLALLALKNTYGKNLVASGPLYKNMQVENGMAVIHFESAGGGLVAKDNKYGYLNGFMIAGADKKFYWAKAWIKNNNVVVWSDAVPSPAAVRYGWTDDNSECNLFNKEGLPASPFKTDDWKGLTDGIQYAVGM
ncbi:MAG: sialate O-acetylesterase [Ferruginibacter sp.]